MTLASLNLFTAIKTIDLPLFWAWFKNRLFWVTNHEKTSHLSVMAQLRKLTEAIAYFLGALKTLEIQNLKPMRMLLTRHQFGGTLAHSFRALTAHKRAMIEEET